MENIKRYHFNYIGIKISKISRKKWLYNPCYFLFALKNFKRKVLTLIKLLKAKINKNNSL